MNEKTAKKLRRDVRRTVARKFVADLDFLKSLPFRDRLGVCWRVLFGKRPTRERRTKARVSSRE